jgi:RNA polymerase sigma-70 factor (ECF subfamily)
MSEAPSRRFATTRWSLILATREAESPRASAALADLCELYWQPVYAFIRRSGVSTDDARDLTQSFFARVLEKDVFAQAQQSRGRFRNFLLTAVRYFLANEVDAARAQKRGGGHAPVPFEFDDGERRYRLEPTDDVTPEDLYERRWALTVLEATLARVSAAYADSARHPVFVALRPVLTGEESESYVTKAAALGMTEGALRVALHRLRQQFSKCLREIVAETVERPDEVDEELRHLRVVLSRR